MPDVTEAAVSPANAPGDHAACDAEIARLQRHVDRLAKEHARHSIAVSAHKGRADQQESRAVRAEKQLARFAMYAVQYDELAEQAAQGQRDSDVLKEIRRRIPPLERQAERCHIAEKKLLAFAAHLPAVLDALTIRLREAEDPANRRRYGAALTALSGEERERSDEKEAGRG